MVISQSAALFMILITTFMWGSWFHFIRRIGNYPVSAFMLWLYTFSAVIVWGAIAILKKWMLPGNLVEMVTATPETRSMAALILVCGALFAIGMQIQMIVVKHVGLILSTSVCATCGILIGTFLSIALAGLPEGVSVWMIILAAFVLLAATLICQMAGRMKDRDTNAKDQEGYEAEQKTNLKYFLYLILCIVFLEPAYTVGMAKGLQTDLNPNGFPALLCIGLLSIGSFLGTLIVSGIHLTKTKQWKECLLPKQKSVYPMTFASAFCHYGGNVLQTIASPVLSVAIAWPMGNFFYIWTYVWGLAGKEFKGAKRKTYLTLFAGMAMYVLGVILLAINLYW